MGKVAQCNFDNQTHTESSYLKLVLDSNSSGNGIDCEESKNLFRIAHNCGPDQLVDEYGKGSDAIQGIYEQITGVPYPDPKKASGVQIPGYAPGYIPGRWITYHKEDSPALQAKGYYKNHDEENACLNFSEIKRNAFCYEAVEDLEKDPPLMPSNPIRWDDACEAGKPPFHMTARIGAEWVAKDVAAKDQKNWRVLRQEMTAPQALDAIQANLKYPDLVEAEIINGLDSLNDPYKILDFGASVYNLMIADRGLNESHKQFLGRTVVRMQQARLGQVKDPIYKWYYSHQAKEMFASFLVNTRTGADIAYGLRNNDRPPFGYWNGLGGMIHGSVASLAGTLSGLYVITKGGAWVFAKGLGAVGAEKAAAWFAAKAVAGVFVGISVFKIAVAVAVITALSIGAVYLWSRITGSSEHEEQYNKKVSMPHVIQGETRPGADVTVTPD